VSGGGGEGGRGDGEVGLGEGGRGWVVVSEPLKCGSILILHSSLGMR